MNPIILLIYLFPIEVYQLRIFNLNLRIFDFFVFIISAFFIVKNLSGSKFIVKFDSIVISLLAILFFGLLSSLLFAENYFLVLKTSLSYLVIVFFYFLLLQVYRKIDLHRINVAVINAGVIISLIVIYQFFSYVFFANTVLVPGCDFLPCAAIVDSPKFGGFGFLGGLMRPPGLFISMNRVGVYLIPACLLAIYYLMALKEKKYTIHLVLILIAILVSLSRNAVVSFILGFFILSYSTYFKFGSRIFKPVLLSFLFVTFALLIARSTNYELFEHFNFFDIDARSEISNSFNFFQHLLVILETNAEHWGFGLGFQNYDETVFNLNLVDTYGAHNNFLTIFGESGFFAIMSYLFPPMLAVLILIKIKPNSDLAMLKLVYFSIFMAIFFSGFIRTYYFNSFSYLFCFLLIHLNENRLEENRRRFNHQLQD